MLWEKHTSSRASVTKTWLLVVGRRVCYYPSLIILVAVFTYVTQRHFIITTYKVLIAFLDHCEGEDSRELDEEHGVDDDPVQGEVLPQLLSWDGTVLDEGGGADQSGKTVDHDRFCFLIERLVWLFQWKR